MNVHTEPILYYLLVCAGRSLLPDLAYKCCLNYGISDPYFAPNFQNYLEIIIPINVTNITLGLTCI